MSYDPTEPTELVVCPACYGAGDKYEFCTVCGHTGKILKSAATRIQDQINQSTAEIIAHGEFKVTTGGNTVVCEGDHFVLTKPDGERITLKYTY